MDKKKIVDTIVDTGSSFVYEIVKILFYIFGTAFFMGICNLIYNLFKQNEEIIIKVVHLLGHL